MKFRKLIYECRCHIAEAEPLDIDQMSPEQQAAETSRLRKLALSKLATGIRTTPSAVPGLRRTMSTFSVGERPPGQPARRGPPPIPAAAMMPRGPQPPDEAHAALAALPRRAAPPVAAAPGESERMARELRQRARKPFPPAGVDVKMDWVQAMTRLNKINEALMKPLSIGRLGKMSAQKKAPKPMGLLPKKSRRGGAGNPMLPRRARGRGLPAR